MFVFGSLLGAERHEVAHGLTFALGLLVVLLAMRAERQVREEVWVAGGTGAGVGTTLRLGAAAGAVAVILGALMAPQLRGPLPNQLVDITEINRGPQTRSVVSPLVRGLRVARATVRR